MPALMMHLRGADALRRELPAPLDLSVGQAPWAYQLGSILVDLPLFEGFWLKVALFLTRRPYPESRWGTVIHTRGSASLAASLLRPTGAHRSARRALVAGMLTHLALDRAMHPAIEAAVSEHLRPDETPSQLHEALENYQSLVWHRTHLNCDGLGTLLLKEGVTVGPGGSRMPRWLVEDLRASLADVYGEGPTRQQVARWASGICAYRDLLSTPFARLGIRSSERFAENRPWVEAIELELGFERGIELAKAYLGEAAAATDEPGVSFIEAVGDGPLV